LTVDLLSAEIGSTTTIVSAFDGVMPYGGAGAGDESRGETPPGALPPAGPGRRTGPRLLAQGSAPTSVVSGDVRIGLEAAVDDLRRKLGADELAWHRMSACSSAAGGLRMSVHGLVYDMTVKAAREAALGAGANLVQVTAGRLRSRDIEKTLSLKANIIMIAGGLDYGERDTALDNAELLRHALTTAGLAIPVIYAGNVENQDEIRQLFADGPSRLYICPNVYPRIDEINIEPARKVIQEVFEEHIVTAPGMEHIRDLVDGPIMPVPGAVMAAAAMLRENIGDLAVIDVGGATTDVHSVCDPSAEVERILIAPEPRAKRTVEGDLGVYVNRTSVLEAVGAEDLLRAAGPGGLGADPGDALRGSDAGTLAAAVANLPPIPSSEEERRLASALAYHAARIALSRHAGRMRELYSMAGKQKLAEGKDLTALKWIIGTGGALTRLPGGEDLLRSVLLSGGAGRLYPLPETAVLLDRDYLMAAAGLMSGEYPEAARSLLAASLGLELPESADGGADFPAEEN
jgi:uncharacterized protein (TIGR01319 family)